MSRLWTGALTLPALALAAQAWADHGAGLRSESNPIMAALIWAGAAFLAGIAIIAIVTVISRRRRPDPPED